MQLVKAKTFMNGQERPLYDTLSNSIRQKDLGTKKLQARVDNLSVLNFFVKIAHPQNVAWSCTPSSPSKPSPRFS
jgi:hypothetical protein